ncbi:Flp family type IVb pilin [Methylobacterium sp. CM6247]
MSAIEYALIASVIVLGIVTALLNYTNRVRELYESVAQAFTRSI